MDVNSVSNNLDKKVDESKTFSCPNCNGNMGFDIKTQKMKCPNCGTEAEMPNTNNIIREYDFNNENLSQADIEWNNSVHVVKCESCGAETTIEKDITSMVCPYCGSSHVLETKQMAGIKPEGIIPFKVDKNNASKIFSKWIKGRWFAPNALKTLHQSDKLKEMYIPYWTYDSETYNVYTARGGKYYYVTVGQGEERHQERRIRWFPVSGKFNRYFDDVLVNAAKGKNRLVERVESFDTNSLVPFNSIYLSGIMAEKYSVLPKDGFEYAKEKMYLELSNDVNNLVLQRYDTVDSININTKYGDIKFKHVLFPIWSSGYQYGNKIYNYVINGYSGQITGTYPKSAVKIILFIIVMIIIIVIIYLLYQNVYSGDSGSYNNSY